MQSTRLKDISERMNISINTVSRALNDKSGVSEETREEIKKMANEMDYQPNVVAQNLRANRTMTIGVIIDDNANPYFGKVLKGIEDTAAKNDYNIILCNTDNDTKREMKAIDILIKNRVEGIIIHPTALSTELIKKVKKSNLEYVFIGSRPSNISVDYVGNNNKLGSYMMTKYLLDKGYKDIAFFNLSRNTTSAKERLLGFKEAHNEYGITIKKEQIYSIDFNDGAYELTKRIYKEKGKLPQCIFCYCDLFASDVMMAAYDLGLKVPEDVAIAGYDNINFSANFRVPLTTINQPKYDIGSKSAEILIHRLNKSSSENNFLNIIYEPELIIRESTWYIKSLINVNSYIDFNHNRS